MAIIRRAPTKARLWLPRSWGAVVLFVMLLAVMTAPVAVTFFMVAVLSSRCFLMSCEGPQPGSAVVTGLIGVALALLPFAGVRYLQGGDPPVLWRRRTGVVVPPVLGIVYLGWLAGLIGLPFL